MIYKSMEKVAVIYFGSRFWRSMLPIATDVAIRGCVPRDSALWRVPRSSHSQRLIVTTHCPPTFDPPAVLVEGWAEANRGNDLVGQARQVKEGVERGIGITLCQLTGAHGYYRHQ